MCLSSNGKLSQHAKKYSDENEGDNPDSFRTWVLQNCRPPSLPRIQILLILQSYHLYTAYNFFFTILFWHITHMNFKCIRFKLPVFLHSLRNNPSFYRIIYNFFHIFTSYIYIYNKYSRVSIQMPKVNILKHSLFWKGRQVIKEHPKAQTESHLSLPLQNYDDGNSPHIKYIRTLKY